MKKNLFSCITLFVAAIMFFSSCNRNHSSYIPKDAFLVFTADGSKVSKAYDKEFVKEQFDSYALPLKMMYPNTVELLYKYIDDPSSLGVNMNKENFIYAASNKDEFSVGFIISIKKQLFEKNLQLIANDFEVDINTLIKEKNGLKYIELDNSMCVGWNKNVIIMIIKDNANFSVLEKHFNLKKDESILSNKDYKEFYKNRQLANLWISSDIIKESEEAVEFADKFKNLTDIDVRNNYGHIHIDVKLDELIVTSKLRMNKTFRDADQRKIFQNASKLEVLFEDIFGDIMGNIRGSRYNYDYDYFEEYDYIEELDYDALDDLSDEEWENLLKMLDEK